MLQGIKDKVGSNAEVHYSLGCKITESLPDWDADKVVLGDPVLNAKRIEDAVKVAQKADIAILVLGGNEQTSREAWTTYHPGDRDNLDLLGNQDDLVKAILATGKPVVVLLLHGRPNSINYIAENVPAILEGWYLGQEGGTAAAGVLFGRPSQSFRRRNQHQQATWRRSCSAIHSRRGQFGHASSERTARVPAYHPRSR